MFLLDTHALIFWMTDDARLSQRARQSIEQNTHPVWISAATQWEIAIKTRKGQLQNTEQYLEKSSDLHVSWGFKELPISHQHAHLAGLLDWKHKDPFDRMLVAQSTAEKLTLVSTDKVVQQKIKTIW